MIGRRDEKLDRLLSGGGLSVQEKEDVLAGALAASGHAPAHARGGLLDRLRATFALPGIGALAAAAAFVLLARDASFDEFKSRGAPRVAPPPKATWLKVACGQPNPDGSCPRSSSLRLGVEPEPGKRALAVAMLDPEGVLAWSFPDEAGRSAILDETRFVAFEIPLGPETTPGIHKVFALRAAAPMARATVRRVLDDALAGGRAAEDPDLVVARVRVAP